MFAHACDRARRRPRARGGARAGGTPDLALRLSLESRKTLAEAAGELARAVETLDWTGAEAGRIAGEVLEGGTAGARRLVVPVPVGVVGAFTAWNFPDVLTARKLGSALAAGCTVVLKAAEATPATAAAFVAALHEAGLPDGAGVVAAGRQRPRRGHGDGSGGR